MKVTIRQLANSLAICHMNVRIYIKGHLLFLKYFSHPSLVQAVLLSVFLNMWYPFFIWYSGSHHSNSCKGYILGTNV